MYIEMTVEEAMKRCKKNTKVLVAEQDLEKDDCDVVFKLRGKEEYGMIFEGIKTASSFCDDYVKQLRLFTAKQDIFNIKPKGVQKIIILRE